MLGFSPLSSAPISDTGIPPPASGAASQTLADFTATAAGVARVAGSASQHLDGLSQTTTSHPSGTASQHLDALTQAVVGKALAMGDATQAISAIGQQAVGVAADLGVASQTLASITQQATGTAFWVLPGCGWMTPQGRSRDVLLRHVPLGRAWLGFRAAGARAYRMMTALGQAFEDAWTMLCTLATEMDPRTTVDLLPDWETALGLPDACLPAAATIEERRRNVWFRLNKKRWSKASDWHQLAAMFGLEIIITPGWWVQKPALYPFCYPKRYDLFPKLGRFRVYIDIKNVNFGGYDYGVDGRGPGYPIPYGLQSPDFSAFMCLIDRVRPANVIVIWNTFPGRLPCVPPDGV